MTCPHLEPPGLRMVTLYYPDIVVTYSIVMKYTVHSNTLSDISAVSVENSGGRCN